MSKINKKKSIVCAVAAGVAAVCAIVGATVARTDFASAAVVVPDCFEETYYAGEEVALTGKKVTYNGAQYDASVLIIAPDGKGYNGEKCLLSQAGTYTVEYRFEVDGKTFLTSETFTVLQTLCETSSARSSVEYTSYTDTVGENSVTKEGLLVNLASGDEFFYNKLIDLSDNTQYDKLLGLFVIPQSKGAADLYKLDVTFTDAYDPSNYVTVTFKTGERNNENLISGKHYYEYCSYMSACAAGQLTTGIDRNDKGAFEYDGNLYYKWVSHAQYGYMFRTSFYGTDGTVKYKVDQATGAVMDRWLEYVPTGEREMEIYFDYAARQIHGANTTPNPTTLVCDLDDSAFFGDIWKGFTTGEVKMSIRGGNYVSASAQFMITEIDGADLSSKSLTDNAPPKISVDTQGYNEKALPNAKKGLPYSIFSAKAVDNYDGESQVTANVYYNYNSNSQINIETKNGAFTPAYNGRYAIVYKASDSSGNVSEKVLYVTAESGNELQIQIDDLQETATVGKVVSVPAYTVLGNSGDSKCSVLAKHKTQADACYEVKNGEFTPMYAGEYEILYAYSDYVESKTEIRALTVETTDEPTIIDEISMPKYLLQNCIYKLPTVTGYVFENGLPIEVETSVSVSENGATRELPNNYFAPQTSGEVTVIYTVKNGELSYSKSFPLTVVDVGYAERMSLENYFLGDVEKEATSKYVQLTARGDETAYFTLPLQVLEFQAKFQIDVEKNAFEKMTVRLYDTKDETISVAFHFINTPTGTQFSVNDEPFAYHLGYDAFRSTMENLTLNYYNADKKVTFDEATFITVTTDENGNPFNGFRDNVAYMSCSVSGVAANGAAGVRVSNINDQPFNSGVTDKIKPQLFILNRDSGLKQVGDQIYIAPAFGFDVLDPKVDLAFAVFDPDGKVCVSDDGVRLDSSADYTRSYLLTAKKLGSYVVRYQVCDGKGNKLTDSYAIKVVDKEPPVITVKAPATTAKFCGKITLQKATVTDNVTEKPTVKTYVYFPDGSMQDVTGKMEFTANLRGLYRVTYMAFDELQNVSFKTFTVTVS